MKTAKEKYLKRCRNRNRLQSKKTTSPKRGVTFVSSGCSGMMVGYEPPKKDIHPRSPVINISLASLLSVMVQGARKRRESL